MISRKDKVLGGMWGLLVGDAAGVPYEFHSDDEIALLDYIDIIPPKDFERSHNSVKAGTCLVTHGHPCNQVCCAIYCLLARRILNGIDISEGYTEAVKSLRNIYSKYPKFEEELEWSIRPDENAVGHGDGYVVDCLRSALMVLKENDTYEKVIKAAISLGNDTDTTAAVAGGIAGIKYGLQSIPQKWMKIMRGKELVEDIFEKLIK